ncbi:hypothetical protein GCM10009779_70240 [Polymorphospora rubra]|uniref:Uncharacterized protein n=1 Tax=Polymorphospora rubra TaxID=338584 RepID=A0A810NDR0_9ACTN|nr:hypothetical protein Prubr_64460 [Polymorphospora rubra]
MLIVGAGVGVSAVLGAAPASAHHGWSEFDTRYAYYLSGELTEVDWGNPHVDATIAITNVALSEGWLDRELPGGLEEIGGQATMLSARPYDGGNDHLQLILGTIEYNQRQGMDRPLQVGDQIEAVGYLHQDDDELLRPETIWLEDGQGIRLRLLALPQEPEPAPQNTNSGATGDEAATPPPADSSDDASEESANEAGTNASASTSAAPWSVTGTAIVAAVAGGWIYLRRRPSSDER